MSIRVVVADDSYLVREASPASSTPKTTSRGGCRRLVRRAVALVDDSHPTSSSPTSACRRRAPTKASGRRPGFRAEPPGRPASSCSASSPSPSYALALLEGGSDGRAYLLKDRVADADDLVDAVRAVAAGGSVIDPKVVEELVGGPIAQSDLAALERLTPREREILGEMAQGKSNAAIAATLILSERAVEKHINSIFSKLHLTEEPDVNRRVKAVLVYLAAAGS